jgi:DNA-binding NtrC family response regulator
MAKVLIIDDEVKLCWSISNILKKEGYETISAYDGNTGIIKVNEDHPDVILLDLRLPDIDGFQVLEKIKKLNEDIPIIMMTAYADVQSAVKAMKMGVCDFIPKPFEDHILLSAIKNAIERYRLNYEVLKFREHIKSEMTIPEIVLGESKEAKSLISQIKQVAPTNITVLLYGESGTGKGILARLIHLYSRRNDKLFITIDCGTLPENLIESELFGYEKGAFTGAITRKLGQIELANEGTLFIDEIGNLNLSMQAKLLRVLEEATIQRIGSKFPQKVNTRIIVATNANLSELVKKGSFREDLYHRISVFIIKVPPLRERKEDIPIFIKYFINEANKELNKSVKSVSEDAMTLLVNYSWPGNIRELKNVIKRAVLLADDIILPEHLPEEIIGSKFISKSIFSPTKKLKDIIKQEIERIEKQVIEDVLKLTNYNKAKAARILGIDRKSLYIKRKKYNL